LREQAQEDLRVAQAAFAAGCESTFCMLLQMAYEKLAKAAFARQGNPPTRTHDGASRLLLLLA
jgi:HEPN domain-containing protein